MTTLRYKGFEANIKYNNINKCFIGKVIGRHYILVFNGKTKNELESSFHCVVEDYLDYCLKNAKPSTRPEERIGIKEKKQ